MRILVTGSSGRIGSAIAAKLSLNHQVSGLDRHPGPHTTLLGDIGNSETLAHALAEVDAVMHTAALHAPHVATHSVREFRRINVQANAELLRLCAAQAIKALVYTSTTSVYGHALVPTDRAVWVSEELTPQPRDIYDQTKLEAEQQCAAATGCAGGLSVMVLRMSRCFVEAEALLAWYRLYRGVDARDVADAHALALNAALRRPGGFGLYNISALSPFQTSDCVALLNDAPTVVAGYFPRAAEEFARRAWPMPTAIDRVYVIDKARKELGYAPRFNFADTLVQLASDVSLV